MKSYNLKIISEKENRTWVAMRIKAIQRGITVKRALFEALEGWVRK